MAIEKRFIHFKKFSDFNSKKLSANEANTQYTVGISGEIQTGSPDVLYQSYVWIKDTKQQWTHGQLYDCSGGNSGEENVQSDWLENNSSSDAYIKNRTHYASFNRIEIPETISTTTWTYISIPNSIGYTMYIKYTFSGQVQNITLTMNDIDVERTLNNGPKLVVTRTTTSIGIKGHYDGGHILEVSTNVVQLPEFFIPSSIARTSNIPSEVYITDFDAFSLGSLVQNNIPSLEFDKQGLMDALAAHKVILVPHEISDNITVKGYCILTGYYEDLLYIKVITEYSEIIIETFLDTQYILSQEVTKRDWFSKQDTLVSGKNIKTINGESILGTGDITVEPLITDFSIADISAYVIYGTNFNYNRDSIINALQNKQPIYIPYENDGLEGYYAAYGFVEDYIYLHVLSGNSLYFIELNYTEGGIADIYERNLDDFAKEGDLATVAFTADYNDLNNKPTIPSEVTEDTVSGWGFTKNTGTISQIRINGSTFTNQTNGLMDIGNYQVPLRSGTNIVTARGNSILQTGDLFNTTIISTNVSEILDVSTGNCYMYSLKQTTPKTFNLVWPGNIYNDTITIIIRTSSTITFTTSSTYSILWANGNIPTFEDGPLYEISFRPSLQGWMGVAVPFTSGK